MPCWRFSSLCPRVCASRRLGGGRVKLDPWDDSLALLKDQVAGAAPDREKMPFEVTPFVIYLTRVGAGNTKPTEGSTEPHPGD